MPTAMDVRQIAIGHGQAKKRNNAIAAVLSGILPAVWLAFHHPADWQRWLLGLVVGLVWANAFEYTYHRGLLHRPHSAFSKGHREHHAQVGTPEEAEHVNLGRSPLDIVLMFAVNGIVVIPMDFLLRLWIAPGIFVGWTIYLLTAEEIHWRIHMNEWLPPGLRYARAYHMAHHETPNCRYNIFLPLFDWLLGNSNASRRKVTA